MGGRRMLAVGCALAAIFAGCGGSSGSSTSTDAASAPTPPPAPATTQAKPPPQIPVPHVREPTEASLRPHPGAKVGHVIIRDVRKGTGPAVRPGDDVKMDYIESNYTSGHEFMRAWGGEPWPTAEVILTPAQVMRGLIIGMTGMRVGGRRQLIVPRHLSDVNDADRAGNSYKEIVYYDIVLHGILAHNAG